MSALREADCRIVGRAEPLITWRRPTSEPHDWNQPVAISPGVVEGGMSGTVSEGLFPGFDLFLCLFRRIDPDRNLAPPLMEILPISTVNREFRRHVARNQRGRCSWADCQDILKTTVRRT
jgi:hypothetical protein